MASYEHTKNPEVLDRLESIYSTYSFCPINSYWIDRVEPDGTKLSFDVTLNHQIWFAAGLKLLLNHRSKEKLKKQLLSFISQLKKHMVSHKSSLIRHHLAINNSILKDNIRRFIRPQYKVDMLKKEYGYHYFNLLGLYILDEKEIIYNDKKIIIDSDGFVNSKYGSGYNPLYFEAAAILSHDKNVSNDKVLELFNKQFSEHWQQDSFSFSRNTNDGCTLNARLYEVLYLNPKFIDIIKFDVNASQWKLYD
jgi:hypothetical protein